MYLSTLFKIVQSCHMHRSSVQWLDDKLEMQCYALYRMILNPLHWVGIPWRYNQNCDGMEEERCPRRDIFICLKVNDYTLKLYWVDVSLSLVNTVWSSSYFHLFYPEGNVVYKPQFMFSQVTLVLVSCGNNYLYCDCKHRKLKRFGPRMSISGAR